MEYLYFTNFLERVKLSKQRIAILCIGTDNTIYDSLGPLVGTLLKNNKDFINIKIVGTMENCVDSGNVVETYESLKDDYAVIVINSVFSENESEAGNIFFKARGIQPTTGNDEKLLLLGDFRILGCVGSNSHNIRLFTVYNLANKIIELLKAMNNYI